MSKGKNAVKKSISVPAEMAEWLDSEEEKTGVTVSRTVQFAVRLFMQKKMAKGKRKSSSSKST